jgi:selenide,water dikinase
VSGPAKRVVLVGAGHAHLQVLERWASLPPGDASVTVVTDRDESVYSGMVPGFVAGDYRADEISMAVAPLAARARATLVIDAALRIDPESHTVRLAGGGEVPWDIASIDVGSSVRGLATPGVREHALATRPVGTFAEALGRRVEEGSGRVTRIVVVGAGAAGVELAFTLMARLASSGSRPEVFLACGSEGLLPSHGERVRRAVAREAAARGIHVIATTQVQGVDDSGIEFASGRLGADLVVWATGAAAPRVVADSPLPHDRDGFVRVEATLQVRGVAGLFAAGDCASIEGAEWIPKSGVYAVREGPVLEANLRAAIHVGGLRPYVPQREALVLLNLGGRRAMATKWGLVASGRWAWIWKDRVDRAFVARFRGQDRRDLKRGPQASAGDAEARPARSLLPP